jgi:hypothetical protein
MVPFLLIGAWQMIDRRNEAKVKMIERQSRRSQSWLIRDVRIFTGDGTLIERGGVLIRNSRIEQIYAGAAPDPKDVRAEAVEAGGRTLLPALIDSGIALSQPGGRISQEAIEEALKAYAYCGVGALAVPRDPQGIADLARRKVDSGEWLGPEILPAPPAPVLSLTAAQAAAGDLSLLRDDLSQQFFPAPSLQSLASLASARKPAPEALQQAMGALRIASEQGALPSPSGGAGGWLQLHGPGLVHELGLWVEAGIAPGDALIAATASAADRAGAGGRLGRVRPGLDATLLIVDGNPLEDIRSLGRIHSVFVRGERLARGELASQNKKTEK